MNKKIIIIGIGGIVVITGAIVIPIVVIGNNNNNEEKNKEDVEAIIKILKSKSNSQKTLILEGNSTGKIISNNKSKIITKIKKLIGFEKLRGVKFDVSLENDVDISTTEKFIIVTIKKEKHSQQLKGENGLKVKRAKNVQEIKIDTIKEYLNNLDNLNLNLPKTNYSTDNEILIAIRKLLATQINNIEIDDTHLITKKENSSEVVLVAAHSDEETTPYEITVNDEDFNLNLNQEEFSEDEKNVKNIKQSLESLTSKEITIDASSGSINNNKNSILEKIQTLSGYPSDLKGVSLSIKDNSDLITLEGTAFTILLSKGSVINQELRGFTVKRSQSQAEIDQNDVDEIKLLLNALNLKKITIDASSGSITTNKNSILEKVQALSGYPSDLKEVIVSIKEEEIEITLEGVAFTILLSKGSVVNQELRGFTVKRSQTPIEINQNDINEVERLLNALTSKEVTIDESSGSITTNKNSILEKVQVLSGYPSDLKGVIVSIKEEETEINLEGVAFTILLSKGSVVNQELRGFTVKRSQSQAETDQNDVDEIKQLLNALNLKEITIDASSGSITTNKNSILEKLQVLNGYPSDLKGVIVSIKEEETEINLEGVAFTILLSKGSVVNQELRGFIVKRSQTPIEKIKNNIKEYLKISINLNIFLPKDTGSDYDEDSKILTAIRKKLEILKPLDFSKNDFDNLINKKQTLTSTPTLITEVAAHDEPTPTSYEITVDGENFVLKLKQNQYTSEEEKNTIINSIKTYLGDENNLNIILPKIKDFNYGEDSKILTAIKIKLIDSIPDFKNYDANLIVKEGSVPVIEVANHDATNPTEYKIIVGGEHFTLKLKQDQFTELEKTKINAIEKHFETSSNLNLILPQTTYSNNDDILNAIKLKLENDIEDISSSDFHLINKKDSTIDEVAIHNQPSTQYIIVVGEDEFTLNLNQDQFSKEEKTKINAIEKHFETSSNLNLILPQTTYSNNDDILNAIKLKLENDIEDISSSDFHLINKKDSTIDEVAAHGQLSTQYIIVVGKDEFTLNLNQDQFSEEEKTKINAIEKHFETSSNLNLILPQTTYSNNDDILNAIKLKLENDIEDISSSDFHLINKKDSTIDEVAAHGQLSTQYIIVVGKDEFTLNLNQDQFSEEEKTKINAIEKHFETSSNLNLILPQTTYSNNDDILNAIKLKLENDIEDISSSDFHLINKKVGSSEVNEVAIHGQLSTQYIIVIGKDEFTLNLNQDQFTEEEKTKINAIKDWLNTLNNLNLILPKNTYSNNDDILNAIKLKLENDIEDISSSDFHLINKKVGSSEVNEVAIHGQLSTQYIIVVGKDEFILNLNQDQFSEEEKTKINAIKTYLETRDNLNLILPKTTYDNDVSILNAIKLKLENDIEDISHLIIKKVGSSVVNEVAIHGQPPTQYIIVVGEDEFTLNLNQNQFIESEKIKINIIKNYLENLDNLNLILPKTTYDNDVSILNAIKLKLVNDINDISSSDSHLIIKKVGSSEVNEVATHGETSTQYEISVGEHEFTLNLNQEEFSSKEKIINKIKTHLENLDNLNLILPKTTYDNDVSILNAIKLKLENDIEDISSSDSHLIIKKVGSSEVNEVAIHGQPPTQFEISVGEHEFTLNLNQEEFSKEEKINKIKTYLETQNNLNFILSKTNYDNDVSILGAIKFKLVNDINDISSSDSHLIIKKVGSSEVNEVAIHGQPPTQFEISVGEHEFTLNLNQEEFSSKEKNKIKTIKTYLETSSNLNLILPKTTYDNDVSILEAIKVKLVNDIETISSSDSHLIIKKVGSSEVNEVATHGETSTQYEISVGEHEFTLNLKQDQFTEEERKINIIKTYLENLDNFNLILSKEEYQNEYDILLEIKYNAINNIPNISWSDTNLIKKQKLPQANQVALHGQTPTPYKITVGKHEFILNLNQDQFSESEKIKAIETYLKRFPSYQFTIPKATYSNINDVLKAIRLKFMNNIKKITNNDFYLIFFNKFVLNSTFEKIPLYNDRSWASYLLSIKESGTFSIGLKQDQFTKQEKNEKIKTYLQNNLNFILPKTTYSNDDSILESIKTKIVNNTPNISSDDSHLIIKKVGSIPITDVAAHDALKSTWYEITVGGEHFTLSLKKEE